MSSDSRRSGAAHDDDPFKVNSIIQKERNEIKKKKSMQIENNPQNEINIATGFSRFTESRAPAVAIVNSLIIRRVKKRKGN